MRLPKEPHARHPVLDAGYGMRIQYAHADRFNQPILFHLFKVEAGDKEPLPLLKLLPRKADSGVIHPRPPLGGEP